MAQTIPEFMLTPKGKYTEYKICAITSVNVNKSDPTATTLTTLVQNQKTNFIEVQEFPPELLRRRFKIGRTYKAGQLESKMGEYLFDYIDIPMPPKEQKISEALSFHEMLSLFNGNQYHLEAFQESYCYKVEREDIDFIIPSFVVALYFYFRSSSMKEAVLKGKIDILYEKFLSDFSDKNDVRLVLKPRGAIFDGPFIYRFLTDTCAQNSFNDLFRKMVSDLQGATSERIPLHVKFPTDKPFALKMRCQMILSTDPLDKPKFYVTEIINDTIEFDFEKLTIIKGVQEDPTLPKSSNPPSKKKFSFKRPKKRKNKVKKIVPSSTFGITVILDDDNELAFGLNGKRIERKCISGEGDQTPNKKVSSNIETDQSFIRGTGSGDGKTSQSSLQSASREEQDALMKRSNFRIFRDLVDHLEASRLVEDIDLDETPMYVVSAQLSQDQINSHNGIDGKPKRYVRATFSMDEINVTLLEIESKDNKGSTWILYSSGVIEQSDIDIYINKRFIEKMQIKDMVEMSRDMRVRFATKNHPHVNDSGEVEEEALDDWVFGVLGKITY